MPSLKLIRKRIGTVKSTQKITRAMKMVAGARLNRAQRRITELRPYAVKTAAVLREVTAAGRAGQTEDDQGAAAEGLHPLLEIRPERRVLLVVLTSDRGLCGSFNANINKRAEREWRERTADGQDVELLVIGRKGRDYLKRRGAPIVYEPDVWNELGWDSARDLGRKVLHYFLRRKDPVDAIYLIYNEFKSAMTQRVVAETLIPVPASAEPSASGDDEVRSDFLFEPSEAALLGQLVPMYVQISILRALYESMASELGARMTAMDSATSNASDMISKLTLQYNRARQAAITTELTEIISGSEALDG
ncbi:MAG: ATP synthase F1 subunit gamma [Myxococcota bacterium]